MLIFTKYGVSVMNLNIIKTKNYKKKPDENSLGFGNIFTDHMFVMEYDSGKGWHSARIEPYGPFSLSPATSVFHYGQAIFEGMKAYRTSNGDIQLFRANDNIQRLNRSAKRMCIPQFDEDFIMDSLKKLLEIDQDWIPSQPGTSLYIRPSIIAADQYLGLKSSSHFILFIIMSPVGAYYSEGFNPVKIWVTKDYVRAVPGGVGEAKTAGNYAASLYATEEASKNGYTQVLWLDGVERKYIEEVGAMNIFFVINNEIITPKLTGSILSGITRDSVIKIAKEEKFTVREERISIETVIKAHEEGSLSEVFGSGTAAVISPVGEIAYGDKKMIIQDGKTGPISKKFFSLLTDIQYGKTEDKFNWIIKL